MMHAGTRKRLLVTVAVAAAAVAALLWLGGCGGEDADDGPGEAEAVTLDGGEWRLVRWRESGIDPMDFTITAAFADGQISGNSGVNTYGGSYAAGPGDEFSVGELASTMMAGPEPDMAAEAAYLRLLQDAAAFNLSGTTLTLFGSDGAESLVFSTAE